MRIGMGNYYLDLPIFKWNPILDWKKVYWLMFHETYKNKYIHEGRKMAYRKWSCEYMKYLKNGF